MFKKLTETLLKVVDDHGDLVSLTNVIESTRMDVLSIVKILRSTKNLFFPTVVYRPTTVKLENLLNMDTVDLGGYNTHSIAAVDFSQQVQANSGMKLLVPSVGETEVSGEAESTLSTTEIKLQYVSAGLDHLDRLIQKSAIDEDHLLIREMKNKKNFVGLGVVYEVMKNENPMTLEQASKGSASAKFLASKIASVSASAGASKTQRLKLEAGCVLGFKVYRLPLETEPTMRHGLEYVQPRDFQSLKRSVEAELQDLREMDQSVKKLIWGPLYATLKCPEALYALNCMLEEGCLSTDGSSLLEISDDVRLKVDNLLKVMGLDSVEFSDPPKFLHPFCLLVDSLSELDQEPLTLILDLDGEDRGQVLKMVESVLEQVYSMDGGAPQWRGQFSENAIGMASQLMDSCGLYLDKNGLDPSLGSWRAPSEALKGLYATLKGLDMLLGP